MRDPSRNPQLAETAVREGLALSVPTLDVTSDQSVHDCFAPIFEKDGPIDVLINNAGVERHGSIEELPMEAFRQTMETNYFGAVRCIREVLPGMRERRSGCIVNMSSVAGKIASSPLGPYSASKFALEAMSEALAQEVRPFGIRVAIVQPGIIDTPMAHAIEVPPPSNYRQCRQFASLFRASLSRPTQPEVVAETVRDLLDGNSPELRYPSGPDAAPFLGWRASMSDAQWIEFNSLEDEDWKARVKADFGMDVDLSGTKAAGQV